MQAYFPQNQWPDELDRDLLVLVRASLGELNRDELSRCERDDLRCFGFHKQTNVKSMRFLRARSHYCYIGPDLAEPEMNTIATEINSVEDDFRVISTPRITRPARIYELANLDILRSVAVLCVFATHVIGVTISRDATFELGHYGVLIFFVHTALVLMMSMDRLSEQGGAWARQFYIHRAFRIYPLSLVCIALALVFCIPDTPFADRFEAPGTGPLFANLLLIQNCWPAKSIIGTLWSLPYEVQMYCVLPALFWAMKRWRSAWALAIVCIGISTAEAVAHPLHDAWLSWYAPCFMGGIVAYGSWSRKRILPAWLWPAWIAMLYFGYSRVTVQSQVVADWTAGLLLGASVPLFREIGAGFVARLAHLIARYSYGIYLSHMPLLWICFRYCRASRVIQWGIFVPLAIVLPVALYHFIEAPMISRGRVVAGLFSGKQARRAVYDRPLRGACDLAAEVPETR